MPQQNMLLYMFSEYVSGEGYVSFYSTSRQDAIDLAIAHLKKTAYDSYVKEPNKSWGWGDSTTIKVRTPNKMYSDRGEDAEIHVAVNINWTDAEKTALEMTYRVTDQQEGSLGPVEVVIPEPVSEPASA